MLSARGWVTDCNDCTASAGKTFIEGESGNGEWNDVPVPQELTAQGITDIVSDYRIAARNAMLSGMNGVNVHAGIGYFIDKLINSNSNKRVNDFGGSIENRARFLLQVVNVVIDEVGADKVGVRLTPMGRFIRMGDDTPVETFSFIAKTLNKYGLAYLHLGKSAIVGNFRDEKFDPEWDRIIHEMRSQCGGHLSLP